MPYLAGEILSADDLNAWLPVKVQKPTATSRNTTVVEAIDPHLQLALPANTTWDFRFVLFISSAANAAGDFSGRLEWTAASASVSYSAWGPSNSLASGTVAPDVNFGPTTRLEADGNGLDIVFGASTTGVMVVYTGTITLVAGAGTLSLWWAQDSSNANNTSVLEGSFATAERVL